jgi:hypothetical protein
MSSVLQVWAESFRFIYHHILDGRKPIETVRRTIHRRDAGDAALADNGQRPPTLPVLKYAPILSLLP